MKNEIVEKIHSVGKVSRIVSKIVTLIGVIACIIVGVMLIFIPADSVKSFNGTASGTIVFDEKKSKMFSFYDSDNDNKYIKFMGAEFKINTTEKVEGNNHAVNIDALAIDVDGRHFKLIGILLCFAGALFFTGLYIVFIFTVRLAKTLEVCESPFEENVLTAMKKLGYSFISFGVLQIALTGISAITIILMIMLVLAMIHIFSYGAELQQESDETV
ncbi:MAG: hypothetical protein K2O29_08345 [Ruminococcus sp.]|nr:hypothetical protein [Ruminococcus sp.]